MDLLHSPTVPVQLIAKPMWSWQPWERLFSVHSIFTGINFLVTIHTMRPAGMTWFRMPLLLWALYATSVIQVLATLFWASPYWCSLWSCALQIGIFDPALGGDPVLFQHFFLVLQSPGCLIMIVPEWVWLVNWSPHSARKTIFGYRQIALSSVGLALIGFIVWGHHLFTSTQSDIANMIFSFLTFSCSHSSAIKVFNCWQPCIKDRSVWKLPMLYGLSFIVFSRSED